MADDQATFPNVYPGVVKIIEPVSLSAGLMDGPPVGITIHDLASRNVESALKHLKDDGVGYHEIIDRDGSFIQTTYFNHKVNHAGKATWNKVSPNRRHIAIALASWGEVTKHPTEMKYSSWAGTRVPLFEVAMRKGNLDNGWYFWDIATAEQETTLAEFLWWAIKQGINPKNICGHDEAATPLGRKNDPGGVLSMTMGDLRNVFISKLKQKPPG